MLNLLPTTLCTVKRSAFQSKDISVWCLERIAVLQKKLPCISSKINRFRFYSSFKIRICFTVLHALRVFSWMCCRLMMAEFADSCLTKVIAFCLVCEFFSAEIWVRTKTTATLHQQSFENVTLTPTSRLLVPTPWIKPHVTTLREWWLQSLYFCFSSCKARHKTVAPPISHLVTFFRFMSISNSAIRNSEISDKLENP